MHTYICIYIYIAHLDLLLDLPDVWVAPPRIGGNWREGFLFIEKGTGLVILQRVRRSSWSKRRYYLEGAGINKYEGSGDF